MLIQHTFEADDPTGLEVEIVIRAPMFTYFETEDSDNDGHMTKVPQKKKVNRQPSGHTRGSSVQRTGEGRYAVILLEPTLHNGDVEQFQLFQGYTLTALEQHDLDSLTVDLGIEVLLDGSSLLIQNVPALYLVPHLQDGQPGDPVLLRRSVYDTLEAEVLRLSGYVRGQKPYLLPLLVNLIEQAPQVVQGTVDETVQNVLANIAGRWTVKEEVRDVLLKLIAEGLLPLFDVPLSLGAVTGHEIAGTFTIRTPDGEPVSDSELDFYRLEAEVLSPSAPLRSQRWRYDWAAQGATLQDNMTAFTFPGKIYTGSQSIESKVRVTVTTFDGTVPFVRLLRASDPQLANLAITVQRVRPARLGRPALPNGDQEGSKRRIPGQVIAEKAERVRDGLIVMVRARVAENEDWRIVSAARTDASGFFSLPHPAGDYVAAQAVLSTALDSPVAIEILPDRAGATISDDFLFLFLPCTRKSEEDKHEGDKEADCGCSGGDAGGTVPRLPGHAELLASDKYSQDVGSGCINLSTPNRTISEYGYHAIVRTSDPGVAEYTLDRTTRTVLITPTHPMEIAAFDLAGGTTSLVRQPVALENPVRWQDSPESKANLTFYQAVTVATGHVLRYRAIFKADGYSLGNLLYSLPLAPGQKKQIVVMDAAHQLTGAEAQQISQGESLVANLLSERDIADQLGGVIEEALGGRSSSGTSGVSAGGGAAGSYGALGGSLGVAGGTANASSSASQAGSRSTAMHFGEKLRTALLQNANSYRQLNASVITTVKQGERYAATTEVVANHNHCHSLTMMYFEVLRHYAVYQELENVEECVFVPLLFTNFDIQNIYKWADVLVPALLPMPSSTSLRPFAVPGRHPLVRAFDANERIKSGYANVDYPLYRYCDDLITSVKGTLRLRLYLPRPKTRFDRILSLPIGRRTVTTQGGIDVAATAQAEMKRQAIGALTGGLSLILGDGPGVKYQTESHEVLTREKIFDHFMTLDENYDAVPPAQSIRVHNFGKMQYLEGSNPRTLDLFGDMQDDAQLWDGYAKILGITREALLARFSGNVIADWDRLFYSDIAPEILAKLFTEEKFTIKPFTSFDMTRRGNYDNQGNVVTYDFSATISKPRRDVDKIDLAYKLFEHTNFSEPYYQKLKNLLTLTVQDLTVRYTTAHYQGTIYSGSVAYDLLDSTSNVLQTPLNSDEQRNPRKEDIYLVSRLTEHLNSNLEHYNKVLWRRLDPDRRFNLLDGFSVMTYDDRGAVIGTRSLASVVKNELLTITGNSLVLPVAAGCRVTPAFTTPDEDHTATLLDHYQPLTPVPPYRLSAPTRGVFMEAIKGECDSCEPVMENTSQDWEKFRTDEPTPIGTIQPPQPTIVDWKAAFKDFAPPLVSIQNTPVAPDPGTALGGITGLLGRPGIFPDVTGLAGTQANAMRTYESNQENARAFAEMAKNLAMQQHNTGESDKIVGAAQAARRSGAMTDEQYGRAMRDHVQMQIDGNTAPSNQERPDTAGQSDLGQAAAARVAEGAPVKVSQTHRDGTSLSLEQEPVFQNVDDHFTRQALTPNQLIGLVGEQLLANALEAEGLIVFRDWTKHVAGKGIDLVALDPKTGKVWLVDNKAQIRGIGAANSLSGEQFETNKQAAQSFLEKSSPHPKASQAARAIAEGKIEKVVGNAWAGQGTTFTKGLFDRKLAVFDIRLKKLFTDYKPWNDAYRELPRGVHRVGLRGAVLLEGTFFVFAVAEGVLWAVRSGESIVRALGDVALNTGFGAILSRLPGGWFAGLVIGLESDESPAARAARKRQETIEQIAWSLPEYDKLTSAAKKAVEDEIGRMLDDPLIIETPPPPTRNEILPGLPRSQWLPNTTYT